MHIITGLAIAVVAARLKNNKALAGLPSFKTGPIQVAHALPGRIRFFVPALRGVAQNDLGWLATFRELEGVQQAEVNTISGSVLVVYNKDQVAPPNLFGALVRFLGLEEEVEQQGTPLLMRELRALGKSLNFSVYNSTHGAVDLWTLILLGLLGLGAKKTFESGWASLPAGFTLLWWAFNGMTNKGAAEL